MEPFFGDDGTPIDRSRTEAHVVELVEPFLGGDGVSVMTILSSADVELVEPFFGDDGWNATRGKLF